MLDSTLKAYATRQLGAALIAVFVAGWVMVLTGTSDARAPASLIVDQSDGLNGKPLAGPATVSDGDTLTIGGVRVRLEGIDAPEAGQLCRTRTGHSWPCGNQATAVLSRLVQGRVVECVPKGADKYGRMLGLCTAGGVELNAEMVRRGLAWAFVRYSRTYVQIEAEARARRLGIWQGEAMPAWEHRAGRWRAAEQGAPAGCAIKGNVTAQGRIYHMPWSPWYEKVRMDLDRGKRWFCSEAEALAAGWRPAESR
jgi:endonuclease YncB( thermonuclease family)